MNQYAQLIRQRYAENEIKVEVMNHPVPQWKQVKINLRVESSARTPLKP